MVVLLACLVLAQDASVNDSTFRAGQWAAQFSGGFNFGSLGALKFRSPTRALVLDARVSARHDEQSFSDSSGTHFSGLNSRVIVSLRFGWRRYHRRHGKIAPHYSFGLIGGFSHQFNRGGGGVGKSESWETGAFADVGATYLVTPQLGIGGLADVRLTYEWGSIRSTAAPRRHFWELSGSAANPTFFVTLFF